jgi:hypothetical protein
VAGAVIECRSGALDTDGKCGIANGGAPAAGGAGTCRAGTVGLDGKCGLQNGQTPGAAGAADCRNAVVGADGKCGKANRDCDYRSVCLSVETKHPVGDGICDGKATGWITNGCDVDLQCNFHIDGAADGTTLVRKSSKKGGGDAGMWTCGAPRDAGYRVGCVTRESYEKGCEPQIPTWP